ncbi:hypothetical protein HYZ76_02760 [Candidatus Falkowbacteria bacterium]|nr:hypothetical protein [Candidatus Falkowbacteria bacterium]
MVNPTEERLLDYFAEVRTEYDALPDEEKRGFTDGLERILELITKGYSPQQVFDAAQHTIEIQEAWMVDIAERLGEGSVLSKEEKENVITAPADRYTVSYWDYKVREVASTSELEDVSTYLLAHPHEANPIRLRVKISDECPLDYLMKWHDKYSTDMAYIRGSSRDPGNWDLYWGPHPVLDVDAVFETEESARKIIEGFDDGDECGHGKLIRSAINVRYKSEST